MAVADKLKQEGWYLTSQGIEQITDNGAIADVKAIIRKAIDYDLKEIGDSSFIDDLVKSKIDSLDGYRVVQIQKIRNVSAPKVNEESKAAPRMLKLLLTDGNSSCQAIEVEHLPALSLSTPPGTKLRFKPGAIPMVHGMLQLRPNLLELLGGRVAPLVEKWELNRTLAKHTRGRIGEEGGPPPWIPFGQKITRLQPNDRNFKSLDSSGKENKENPEFEAQRKDAIAEAARAGNKKVFGGGTKQMLDHNVQQIVDMGFSVPQAEYALKQNRNNVDRALRSLQRREEPVGGPKPGKSEGRGRRKGDRDKEDEGAVAKPSSKVSLFDFLEDKLPNLNEKEPERKSSNYGERRGGGGVGGADRRNNDSRDYQYRDQNHTENRRGGGGYSRQYHTSDSSTWSSDRPGRQGERNQGQKPPRFQQQAQRFQQKQYQAQSSSKQSPTHNNSSPFDSYQTWSSGSSNEFQNQWGSFSAFSGLTNDTISKDVFKQNSSRSNNDDHIGQWKPPGPKDRWKQESDSRPSNTQQQSQFQQPPPPLPSQSCFPDFGAREETSRNSHIFGGDTNNHPFSLVGSQLNFSSFQAPSPDPSPSSFIPDKLWEWHEGDKCMAKYWEDNRHYRADVTGVSDRTVVVRFVEYGNFEEVLHEDCIPITEYD